jgi:exopolysaccharide biosynthesis polyprenyl glycosylphosphotransferase
MTGRQRELFAQINQVVDALLLGVALWVSYLFRTADVVEVGLLAEIPPFARFLWMLAVLMPFGPLLLEMYGFYRPVQRKKLGLRLNQILKASVWVVLLLGLCVIFLRVEVPSRSVLIILAVLAPALLLLRDAVSERVYSNLLRHGDLRESIILAGEPLAMDQLWRGLSDPARHDLNAVERVDLTAHPVDSLVDAIHRHSVGRVVLCFQKMNVECVQESINACENEGIEVWLNVNFIRTAIARPAYDYLGGHPMLVFRATPELSWGLFCKSIFDRSLAFFALLCLAPLFGLIALAIRWTSPGPIFFRQERSGLHGRRFTMFKFRSMVSGAEKQRDELEGQNEMSGPVFKLTNDPRVTPIGKFLRRTSLDELPQLFNVLRGEMSIVGPRPLPVYEVAKFDQHSYRRRLSMKPGLTCLWQVRGRNEVTDFKDWLRMDLEYIDNWSPGLDIAIVLKTIPVVLFGRGAK